MSASQTVCAPVVQQATTEMQARLDAGDTTTTNDADEKHQSIADKLHGLSEKIQQLGHIHQTEGGSGGDGGSRSRTGVANNYSTIHLQSHYVVLYVYHSFSTFPDSAFLIKKPLHLQSHYIHRCVLLCVSFFSTFPGLTLYFTPSEICISQAF